MKKIIRYLLIAGLFLTGCSKPKTKVKTYLIPNSLISFAGVKTDEYVNSMNKLGENYLQSAEKTSDGIEVEMTEEQNQEFIRKNEGFVQDCIDDFTGQNELYSVVYDDYSRLELYFDEHYDYVTQLTAIVGLITYFGILQIFTTADSDWGVEVIVYNCHTKKQVTSAMLPEGGFSIGEKEWKASYE